MRDARNRDFRDDELGDDVLGSSRPALKADTLGGADAVVVTVADVEKVTVHDTESETGERTQLILVTEEYEDRAYWVNKTGARTLVEQLGPRPRSWIGQRVPLVVVRVNNPRKNEIQKSLQVAPAGEWADVLDQFSGRRRRSAAPARKTTTKKKATRRKR